VTASSSSARFTAVYRVACEASRIEARAQALALEQSVELPLDAVHDRRVRDQVVARVESIRPVDHGAFEVAIALATETVGHDAGQLMNMLFGNASLQEDVALIDVEITPALASLFGGPRFGIAGLRALTGVHGRPLSCTALKPQGMTAMQLAELARTFADTGIDVIKDDHGLADQSAAPFDQRVPAVARAIDGMPALYAPSITGSLDDMRRQLDIAQRNGVRIVLVTPMVSGVSNVTALAREAGVALLAHPALAGAARIAPHLLLGKLFRLFGADATIFPNAGGRFGYSQAQCLAIAAAVRETCYDLRASLPVPAGGMNVERVPEMRERYGDDTMFLIGGSLLVAASAVRARCRAFADAVRAP